VIKDNEKLVLKVTTLYQRIVYFGER
jgi:hypothetical protein